MENEILVQLEQQEAKIDELTKIVKSIRNYYRVSAVLTFIFFVLPLLGFLFSIPWLIRTLNAAYTLPSGL